MSDRRGVPSWVWVVLVIVSVAGVAAGAWALLRWLQPRLIPVPAVDLDRLAGSWHAIAALPASDRDTAPGEALRILHEGDGELRISRLARSRKGTRSREAIAMASEDGTRLRISRGGGLGRELVVLALTPTYDAVLIGSPDRRRAWMLSRTRTLSRTSWRFFRDELARQGFPTHRIRQAPGTRVHLDEPAHLPDVGES